MSDRSLLAEALPSLASERFTRLLTWVDRLSVTPPQVLLFEGGSEAERRDMARYWACCTMCQHAGPYGPCLSCRDCRLIVSNEHFDVLAYDGTISAKDDSEEAFFRVFNADNARNIKVRLRDAPQGRYHVVFFTGIAKSRPEAPNSLLKIFEEPSSTSLFVLLVPQRQQILPTLVSRAFSLTLPWEDVRDEAEDVAKLTTLFANFLFDRSDFLGAVATKSFMTEELAQRFFIACQKTIVRVLSGERERELDKAFARLSPAALEQIIFWSTEAEEMLRAQVNPARVLQAFAMRVNVLAST